MNRRRVISSLTLLAMLTSAALADEGGSVSLRLTATTALEFSHTPMDPTIDFGAFVREAKRDGVFDPNSIEVWNMATGERVPHAITEDFADGDRGRVEFVIADRQHTRFEIWFRTVSERPPLQPPSQVPAVGVGDLLRYNAGVPRPITLFYSMGLHDLNGDGTADLVGTWNYAYRPGSPWDGVICYPRAGENSVLEFGDLTRLRYDDGERRFFSHIYMAAAFADFNGDGLIDLVRTRQGATAAGFFLNTGERDPGGMPVFKPAGSATVSGWQACRAVDLDGDGAIDLVVDGKYVRNTNSNGWPFEPAAPVPLNAGRQPCFLDVDRDDKRDAICLHGGESVQPDFYRIAWRKNLGGDPPQFGDEQLMEDIDAPLGTAVSTYRDGDETGLLVQHNAFQEISFFRLVAHAEAPKFERRGRAESRSAVLSLSDQAWPCLCDWDADGDVDLLVGGGYGWPRIVINEGTRTKPAYAEPQFILADGEPIRLIRNKLLGDPPNGHDMGYPYPDFVDWDADGLPDLVLPNETNRLYWYKNVGTQQQPRFAERRQIECDGFADTAELRALSATRAANPGSNNGVYPLEPEQPFFWRTGVAIADFNGDNLPDLVTHDGYKRVATLFERFRREDGSLRLRKGPVLKLEDGTPINDAIVGRTAHWTESFRAVDWDQDGLQDLMYSIAGAHHGALDGGSIYLLRNTGTPTDPQFAPPVAMRCFGEPIRITNHGPNAWPGDYDGDGQPDIVACVEWSVYPYYAHAALMMPERPQYTLELLPSPPNSRPGQPEEQP